MKHDHKIKTLKHVVMLTGAALAIGIAAMVGLASVSRAADPAPAGFAEAQLAALWKAVQASPKLVGVDQITIEGPGTGPVMTGWLQKTNWVDGKLTKLEKRFWSRIDRTCAEIKPECFRPIGIWSGSELLAHLTGE